MIIYDKDGVKLLETEVDDTSVRYKAIKGDNSLTLKFSLSEHLELPLGCWCEFKGETYSLMAPSDITMHHRRNFEYSIIMYGDEAKAKRFMFVNPIDGRLKFTLTAYPNEHLQMFVDNMNNREPFGKKDWQVGECIKHDRITLSYNMTYCHDALVQLANELELDYWFDGKTVNIGKLEVNKESPLPLSYGGDGEGLKAGIKRTNYSNALPVEILYVSGSEENIDFSKYGSNELHLPMSATIGYDGEYFSDEERFNSSIARWYVVDDKGYSIRRSDKEQKTFAEDSLDCSEIIPAKEETVTNVIVVNEEKHFYDLLFQSDVDYKEYQIGGETAHIVFQSGMLSGKEFDLATNDAGKIICKKEGRYWRVEIKPQEIDGITMPDSATGYVPKPADKFKVFGIQLPDEYICNNSNKSGAEWDMLRYAVKHLYANEVAQYTISGELDEIYARRNWSWLQDRIVLGGYVAFSDRSFQEDAILIRITGIKEFVNKPYSPKLELSNQNIGGTLVGTLNRIENQEVYNEELHRQSISFSKRRFRDAQETISMLEKAMLDGFTETVSPIAVKTMSMLVGDESLQFRFVNRMSNPTQVDNTLRYDTLTKKVMSDASIIQHMTLGITEVSSKDAEREYKFWNVGAFESEETDADTSYYLYIKASKSSQSAEFVLSADAITMDGVSGYYHFLTAILNKEIEGSRSFVPLYGYTEVLPGQITTDVIRSADGKTYFDLARSVIGGNITFVSNQGEDKSLADFADGISQQISDADYLTGAMKNGKTIVDGGLVMASVVAVTDTENATDSDVEAFLNGSDFARSDEHGKLILAGGIPQKSESGSSDLKDRAIEAETRIYEDGCTFTKNLYLEEGCQIGNINVDDKGLSAKTEDGSITSEVLLNPAWGLISERRGGSSHNYAVRMGGSCDGVGMRIEYGDSGFVYNCLADKAALNINCEYDDVPAIRVQNGMIAGLRPNIRMITQESASTEYYLDHNDHTIILNDWSGYTRSLYLPDNPKVGQRYDIYTTNSGMDLRIYFENDLPAYNFITGLEPSSPLSFNDKNRKHIELFYCSDRWWLNYRYLY